MTCRYLTSRTVDTDATGRPVQAHGYACGQPAIAEDACARHLTAAAGLSPRIPLYGWAGFRP